ncbi:putative lipoate-protein ligase [Triangularia setosa]|uniref:lipoyl(octanoyl) transferase n=1 Tax=Triangularia setosa TaxID=2587417 RepID=A0AAN6WGD4_9PEZI|nr:putative lipoate-protein ligase [Podospora setosa]
MPPLRLQHLHLPSLFPIHFPPYSLASKLQTLLRRQHLNHKDSPSDGPPPPPTLISFTPLPIYTLGRRQSSPLSPSEIARLSQPLTYQTTTLPVTTSHSPRGGLTTYHGPGQVVLWPVLDIHSKHHKTFTVRCYSRLLESTTIATLEKMFGIKAFTTDDPGVWVNHTSHLNPLDQEECKIAALGVHLRRHISGLGTAINIGMPGTDVLDEKVNPWKRIVACGIEGKSVTSVREQLPRGQILRGTEEVADHWGGELARRIEVEGVEKISGGRVIELLEEAMARSEEGEEGEKRREGEYIDEVRKGLGGWVKESLDRGV